MIFANFFIYPYGDQGVGIRIYSGTFYYHFKINKWDELFFVNKYDYRWYC